MGMNRKSRITKFGAEKSVGLVVLELDPRRPIFLAYFDLHGTPWGKSYQHAGHGTRYIRLE